MGSLPSFLGLYTVVCLIPATLSSLLLVLFYFSESCRRSTAFLIGQAAHC